MNLRSALPIPTVCLLFLDLLQPELASFRRHCRLLRSAVPRCLRHVLLHVCGGSPSSFPFSFPLRLLQFLISLGSARLADFLPPFSLAHLPPRSIPTAPLHPIPPPPAAHSLSLAPSHSSTLLFILPSSLARSLSSPANALVLPLLQRSLLSPKQESSCPARYESKTVLKEVANGAYMPD
jgi:hypothetical protein